MSTTWKAIIPTVAALIVWWCFEDNRIPVAVDGNIIYLTPTDNPNRFSFSNQEP